VRINCFDKVKNKSLLALKADFESRVPEDTDLSEIEQKEIGKNIVLAHYDNLIKQYNDLRTRIDAKLPAIAARELPTKKVQEIRDLFSDLTNKELENGPAENVAKPERSTEVIISAAEVAINKGQAAKTEEEVDDAIQKVEASLNEIQSKVGKLTENWSTEDIDHELPNKVIGKKAKTEVTKYLKEVSRINGWQVQSVYPNIAPAGGDIVARIIIPGTQYQMYIQASYEPQVVNNYGGYEDYQFKGLFYRLEEPAACMAFARKRYRYSWPNSN